MIDWKKKKVALYLRRSKGEKGTTKKQLARVMPLIEKLEKAGKIQKLNRTIVGRDINKKKRFKASDLDIIGDIYNEGEGQSAFGEIVTREVLMELLERVRKDGYDGVMFEKMDRLTRDPPELGEAGIVHLYRRQGKHFVSLSEPNMGFVPDDAIMEAVTTSLLQWGGVSKLGEIASAEVTRLGDNLDRGYFLGGAPEFLGTKGKDHGFDYRKAWGIMQAHGENPKTGSPNDLKQIAESVGKTDWDARDQYYKPNRTWVKTWYGKMKNWDELGVLDDWLSNVEALNQYTRNVGEKVRHNWKHDPGIKRIRSSTSGYFAYPAGVNPAGSDEFVVFPNPMKIGLEKIVEVESPLMIEEWNVIRKPVGSMKLHVAQTQPRAGEK